MQLGGLGVHCELPQQENYFRAFWRPRNLIWWR